MSEGSRRFTDREVAIVLRRAAELDEGGEPGSAGGSGLSLQDLTEIAAEVGISANAIERAVASLDRGPELGAAFAGAPLARKAAHAVPGELDRDAIARLVGLVDERAAGAGAVSEALGSVRWTSSDRFRSTRVSITPTRGETVIEVVEKAPAHLRRVLHAIPALWGLGAALPFIEPYGLSGLGAVAMAVLGIGAGALAGRGVWNVLSAASGRRVRRLAEGLADAAHEERGGASPAEIE